MRAAVITAYGNDPEVVDVDRPELPADSVMVEVHAASVNPIDGLIMEGHLQDMLPYELPWIVGYDVAGVVTDVGPDVSTFSVGDAVFGRADGMQAGTMAEYAAIKATDLALQPTNIGHDEAAGIPLAGLTAWQGLVRHGGLQPGQRVLITAGSGGVGTLAIQIAKHFGAWVATTTSGSNAELVRSLGADDVINYRDEKFEDRLADIDLVFDAIGGDTLRRTFDVVRRGGAVVSIKGEAPEGLADERGVSFEQFFMSPDGATLAEMAGLIESGAIRPIVDTVFPLDDVTKAYDHSRDGHAVGKIIVSIR